MPETNVTERPDRLYIQFATNGNIRKWQRDPFDGGTQFVVAELWYASNRNVHDLQDRLTASEAAREKLTATLEDIANDRPLDLKAFARAALNTSEAHHG